METATQKSPRLRRLYLKTRRELPETQRIAGRYNPGLEVRHNRRWIPIGAGTADNLQYWSMGWELFVLSVNSSLGYIGLEVFDARDGCLRADLFSQNASEELREDIFDLSDATILRIVNEYVR